MHRTRILVTARPAGLRAAVHTATSGAADLVAVDVDGGEVELLLRAGYPDAGLVVVAMTGRTLPPLAERLLDEYPRLAVLAVDLGRGEGLLHRMCPATTLLQDLAGDGLAAVLRRAATGGPR